MAIYPVTRFTNLATGIRFSGWFNVLCRRRRQKITYGCFNRHFCVVFGYPTPEILLNSVFFCLKSPALWFWWFRNEQLWQFSIFILAKLGNFPRIFRSICIKFSLPIPFLAFKRNGCLSILALFCVGMICKQRRTVIVYSHKHTEFIYSKLTINTIDIIISILTSFSLIRIFITLLQYFRFLVT